MIDFNNKTVFKLKKADNQKAEDLISSLLIDGEEIISTYKALRDEVVFTNKRIIAINVQGITGTKKDYTSLPYSKIQAFSVETAGLWESQSIFGDAELEIYFSGLGKVKFEFTKDSNIVLIGKIISGYVL